MILFFGDSLTSGENNNFIGFVEKLNNKELINYGVSGTCIGDYSLYPVQDTNLLQQVYKHMDEIKKANKIFLEYGSNDISSILCEYVTLNQVKIDFIKCIDFIKQINNQCDICFITLGKNIVNMAKGQCNYLNNDYLKTLSKKIKKDEWIRLYADFTVFISNIVKTVELPLFELDSDMIHPNDKGYEEIANVIKESL